MVDCRIYSGLAHSIFNVKSYYALLHYLVDPTSVLFHVCSIQGPPEVMAFSWMSKIVS